jgi:hypothetical protein
VSDWLVTSLGCVALVVAGWPWAQRLPGARPTAWAAMGLAYLCGTALFTLAMLAVAFLGLDLNRLWLAVTLAAVWGAGFAAGRRPPPAPAVAGAFWPAVVPLLLAAATLAFGLLQAFRLGSIESIDFLKAWGLKGTALFEEGNLDFSQLSGPHLFYPLEVSNLNGAFYVLLGHVDDEVVRLPAALFGIALALVLWWLARLMLPPVGAAFAVALAVMTPELTGLMTNGLADLALAAYVTVCALAAHRWLEDGASWAPLCGFAAGAAAWTKLEGTLTCLVILAGVMVARRAIRAPGLRVWLAWFAVFVVPWQVFQRLHDIPANRSHFKTIYLDVPWILDHVSRTLAETSHWGIFWPLCLFLIAAGAPLWWSTPFRRLAAVTLPNVIFTLGAYVTHYRAGEADSVEATAHRLYLHIAPSMAVMAAASATVALGVVCAWRREAHAPRPIRVPEPSECP